MPVVFALLRVLSEHCLLVADGRRSPFEVVVECRDVFREVYGLSRITA